MPLRSPSTSTDGKLDFDAQAHSFRLEKAPRAQDPAGSWRRRCARKGHDRKGALEADVTADVSRFEYEGVELAHGRITGTAKGPLKTPKKLRIDARLEGRNLLAGDASFDRVRAHATGPAARPKLDAKLTDKYGPEINASATLSTEKQPALHGLSVEVKRDDAALVGKVERFDLGTGEVSIRDVKISGAGGELAGSVRISKQQIEVHAKGEQIDLDRAARALGLPRGLLGGKLNIDADVSIGKGIYRARSPRARRRHRGFGRRHRHVARRGARRHFARGQASALIKDVGAVGAVWETTLAGSPLETASWRDMIGSAQVNAIEVELSHLKYILPKAARIESVKGKGFGQFSIERRIPAALPSVLFIAGTQGLEVVREPDEPDAKPLHIKGIDMQVGGQIDGATGERAAPRGCGLRRRAGSRSGGVGLDLMRSWGARRDRQAAPDDALQRSADVPSPSRLFAEPIRVESLTGVVAGDERHRHAETDRERLGASDTSLRRQPAPCRSTSKPSRNTGRADVPGSVEAKQGGRRVALLLAQGRAEWHGVTRGHEGDDAHWLGGAQVVLEGLPLAVFGPLADARVGGELHGTIAVHRPHGTAYPLVNANVEVRKASIDQVPVGAGRLKLRSDGRLVNASLDFSQGRGRLSAQARAGLAWEGLTPVLDDARPVIVDAQARQFDAIVLSPFLKDVFSELSGPVNGSVTAIFKKPPAPADPDRRASAWRGGSSALRRCRRRDQLQALGLSSDVSFRSTARSTKAAFQSTRSPGHSGPNLSARGRSTSRACASCVATRPSACRRCRSCSRACRRPQRAATAARSLREWATRWKCAWRSRSSWPSCRVLEAERDLDRQNNAIAVRQPGERKRRAARQCRGAS
jgi:hypothetical protein